MLQRRFQYVSVAEECRGPRGTAAARPEKPPRRPKQDKKQRKLNLTLIRKEAELDRARNDSNRTACKDATAVKNTTINIAVVLSSSAALHASEETQQDGMERRSSSQQQNNQCGGSTARVADRINSVHTV